MAYQTISSTPISNGVTTVDCQKQVRSWRLLRYLVALLIPTCHRSFIEEEEGEESETKRAKNHYHHPYYNYDHRNPKKQPAFNTLSTSKITGTIFGFRRGKANLCIQSSSNSAIPILLLELAVPTTVLAREMQGGILRIVLECTSHNSHTSNNKIHSHQRPRTLLSTPLWTMYCNGRKVGYAVKRRPSEGDMDALRLMGSVAVGAGIINGKELKKEDDLMYLRAKFERVCGSSEAESFHLIDPDGSIGQELSIFLFHSR